MHPLSRTFQKSTSSSTEHPWAKQVFLTTACGSSRAVTSHTPCRLQLSHRRPQVPLHSSSPFLRFPWCHWLQWLSQSLPAFAPPKARAEPLCSPWDSRLQPAPVLPRLPRALPSSPQLCQHQQGWTLQIFYPLCHTGINKIWCPSPRHSLSYGTHPRGLGKHLPPLGFMSPKERERQGAS